MDRLVLTDAQWAKMEPHCLGKPSDPGRSGSNNRLFVEAVLWIARTGSPWRDLRSSSASGTVCSCVTAIGAKPVFSCVFSTPLRMSRTWNMPWSMPRSSRFTVTDRAQRGTQNQAIGKSKGGMTTKILALTDALGNLVRFVLLPGQRFETVGVEPLIEGIDFGALLGDKAFDSNAIVAVLNKRGAKIVISQHPRRAQPLKIDEEMYKWRHLIENFFCKLKEFKRIAMRCDKTDQSFAAMIYLAAAVIN